MRHPWPASTPPISTSSSRPTRRHVTEADLATERAIRAILEAERPADGVFGEEFGVTGDSRAAVDHRPDRRHRELPQGHPDVDDAHRPVDRRRPARRRREPARARPALVGGHRSRRVDEHARRRHAAHRASRRSTPSPRRARASRASASGTRPESSTQLVRLSRAVWRDRGYGDTWPYMLLAEGRLEFVAEFGVKEYDIAALVPIITEAGGRFTSFDGNDSHRRAFVARHQRHPSRRLPRPPALSPDPTESTSMTRTRSPGSPRCSPSPATAAARHDCLRVGTADSGARLPSQTAGAPVATVSRAEPAADSRPRRRVERRPDVRDDHPGGDRRRLRERRMDRARRAVLRRRARDPRGHAVRVGRLHAPATDHVQIFGWAPITEDGGRRRRRTSSSRQGWVREESRRGRLHHREPGDDHRDRRGGLRHDLPLRRRLGEVRRHQAGPRAHRVAAELTAQDA